MINKRGELTTQQIVLLIILITSFVVILFFLFRLDLGKESKSEICHNSVITKGNSVLPEESVELKCSREYVCITSDGTCEGLTKPEKFEVNSKEEIYQVLADKMADCWWMFGEGKINYIGEKLTHKNYCSICSQVLFDDSLNNLEDIDEGKINKDEFYDYLSENEISEGETYSDYLFGISDIESLKKAISDDENNTAGVSTFGEIDVGKQYYVVMGITSEVDFWRWVGVSGTGAAGTVGAKKLFGTFIQSSGSIAKLIPGAKIVGIVIVAGGLVGGSVAELIEPEIGGIVLPGDGIPNNFLRPTIQEINSDKFNALNCEEVVTYA